MPPPNVTGKLHMGHAMFATLQVGGVFCMLLWEHSMWIACGKAAQVQG